MSEIIQSESVRPVEGDFSIAFILSTGRTGTMLLTHLLQKQYPNWMVVHEPSYSRGQYLLGNFSEYMPLVKPALLRWFKVSRDKLFHKRSTKIGCIEINPMLCALTDIIPKAVNPLRVVHIVRDPRTWVESMRIFKASHRFRSLIGYIPFNHPAPKIKYRDHSKLNEYERLLWRWRRFNENLSQLENHCDSYCLIRFEDLIGSDLQLKQECMRNIIKTLDIDGDPDVSWYVNPPSLNIRTDNQQFHFSQIESGQLHEVCGELMERYGYV
jgi:hypothetical protein